MCLVFATPFAAIWIDQRRAIVRIDAWLNAGEKTCLTGTLASKGAQHTLTIDETTLRVWQCIDSLSVGQDLSVEFLPTKGKRVLHGVLRVNGEDNPYFCNALFIGPPGP